MDFFHQSHPRKLEDLMNYHKKRLTQEQIRLLESSFNVNNKLDPDRKSQLAQQLGLPPRKVAIWYQNKRARWKNQSLEVDHKALQSRLASLVSDNQRLQTEVDRLKRELHKTQELLLSSMAAAPPPPNNNYSSLSSLSTSCDEVGSSGQLIQLRGSNKNIDRLLDKDLFACFVTGGSNINNGQDFFSQSLSSSLLHPPSY